MSIDAEIALIVAPRQSPAQCLTCQGAATGAAPGYCSACIKVRHAFSNITSVQAISIYWKPSRLRDLLTFYKSGRENYLPAARSSLAKMLASYWQDHVRMLETRFGRWDALQVVPSTRSKSATELVFLANEAGLATDDLIRWSGLPAQHRQYTDRLFSSRPGAPRRVLLLEDAYVSGSRSQSAAATLQEAGHNPVGILALGRRVNPGFDAASETYWRDCMASCDQNRHAWMHES